MVPPHAKPAQPTSDGAVIWMTVSNSLPAVALSGMATRNAIPLSLLYDANFNPVKLSTYACESGSKSCRRIGAPVSRLANWKGPSQLVADFAH